jgi:hypothetical protein
MLHQQDRGAISKIVVPETSPLQGPQNNAPSFSSDMELDKVLNAVTETLQFAQVFRRTKRNCTRNRYRLLVNA